MRIFDAKLWIFYICLLAQVIKIDNSLLHRPATRESICWCHGIESSILVDSFCKTLKGQENKRSVTKRTNLTFFIRYISEKLKYTMLIP